MSLALLTCNRKYPTPLEGGIICLLYTSDAADERSSVDLGGRRIIKKKIKKNEKKKKKTVQIQTIDE